MLIRVPEYFTSFRCIADRCQDSCCIGWEIDIDDDARIKYEHLNTPLGEEIREKTSHGYFPLSENGRCAFLDCNGLCRIVSELGEGYLCDICNEHPRYYGVCKDGYEGGLGLSCEEAARMILSLREIPKFVTVERDIPYSDEDGFASMSDSIREDLYQGLFSLSIPEILGKYTAYSYVADEAAFNASADSKAVTVSKPAYMPMSDENIQDILQRFLDILSECEALSDDWNTLIRKAKFVEYDEIIKCDETIRPLAFYFTHRYVRDGIEDLSLCARVMLAIGSALATVALSRVIDGTDKEARAAVLYSKNIEYSTDNIDYILDNINLDM